MGHIVSTPDWNIWRNMNGVKLWQACALSLNFNPDSLKTIDHQYGMKGPAFRTGYFPSDEVERDFHDRLRVLESHKLSLRSGATLDDVSLAKVAGLCASFDWTIPPEMVAMCVPVAPLTGLTIPALPIPPTMYSASDDVKRANVAATVNAPAQRNSTKQPRRDSIDPVIEKAQAKCTDKTDTAEVWAQMQPLAEAKMAPFLGATEDGLQYLTGGQAKTFTRDALNKRLHPEKRGKPGKRR